MSTELQAEYERLTERVIRKGSWLMESECDQLSQAEWDRHFAAYRADLEEMRRLGDLLRPACLREETERPETFMDEFADLFAAEQ